MRVHRWSGLYTVDRLFGRGLTPETVEDAVAAFLFDGKTVRTEVSLYFSLSPSLLLFSSSHLLLFSSSPLSYLSELIWPTLFSFIHLLGDFVTKFKQLFRIMAIAHPGFSFFLPLPLHFPLF
jgi:hypothetical protein